MEDGEIQERLNEIFSKLQMKWTWKPSVSAGIGFAEKAVWSRASRRQNLKQDDHMEVDDDNAALGFKISVDRGVEIENGDRVTVRWLQGRDSVLFESFCGMMKRKIDELSNEVDRG